MKSSLSWVVCFGLIVGCHQSPIENPDRALLKNMPAIGGNTYNCAEMVRVVNHLRGLGKEKSLAVLREYLVGGGENAKVLVICRLLFVNPKGWNAPGLGQPWPPVANYIAETYPLFPIALSDGVPFMLVVGYQLEGKAESAMRCLDFCKSLELVKNDYPSTGYEQAANALVQTDLYRQLYQDEDKQRMVDMILRQAKSRKQMEKQ